MASALNGSCVRRSNFISAIAGSAASNSMTRFLIIRRSQLIGMGFRDSDIFRQVFEAVVRACMDAGLVKGEVPGGPTASAQASGGSDPAPYGA
jgi:hypothetical protein